MAVTNMYSASLEPYQSISAKNNYNFGVKLAKKSLQEVFVFPMCWNVTPYASHVNFSILSFLFHPLPYLFYL